MHLIRDHCSSAMLIFFPKHHQIASVSSGEFGGKEWRRLQFSRKLTIGSRILFVFSTGLRSASGWQLRGFPLRETLNLQVKNNK